MGWVVMFALGGMLFLYLGLVATLFCLQRDLIYPAPNGVPGRPGPGFEEIRMKTADGLVLRAFYHPARGDLPTLLFFHGNAGDLDGSIYATRFLVARGYGVLAPEYRGYGGNPGAPSEQGLYRDGEAAITWLATNDVPPGKMVVIGNSLGSGVATQIASRHRLAGLVLISGFASLDRVVHDHYPFIPARLLVLDRYDNLAKIPAIGCPILLLHGTADAVASAENSRVLAMAQPRAQLRLVPGVGHELVSLDISQTMILEWLRHAGGAWKPASL